MGYELDFEYCIQKVQVPIYICVCIVGVIFLWLVFKVCVCVADFGLGQRFVSNTLPLDDQAI